MPPLLQPGVAHQRHENSLLLRCSNNRDISSVKPSFRASAASFCVKVQQTMNEMTVFDLGNLFHMLGQSVNVTQSLIFPQSCVGFVDSKAQCARPTLLSRLFNGRLSPINLSRFSSFATANAPEENLGSREEDGSIQASLHRSILRTQARHCCWVTAKNEESSPSASGSSELQKSCATHAGSQSSNGTIAARTEKLMRAEMISFAVDSEVACP